MNNDEVRANVSGGDCSQLHTQVPGGIEGFDTQVWSLLTTMCCPTSRRETERR